MPKPHLALIAAATLALALPAAAQDASGLSSPHSGTLHSRGHPYRQGRRLDHLSVAEQKRWMGGEWRHTQHAGFYGWWWVAGGRWYWFSRPVYPYPTWVPRPAPEAEPEQ